MAIHGSVSGQGAKCSFPSWASPHKSNIHTSYVTKEERKAKVCKPSEPAAFKPPLCFWSSSLSHVHTLLWLLSHQHAWWKWAPHMFSLLTSGSFRMTNLKRCVVGRQFLQHVVSQPVNHGLPGFAPARRAVLRLDAQDGVQDVFGQLTLVGYIGVGMETKNLWGVISWQSLRKYQKTYIFLKKQRTCGKKTQVILEKGAPAHYFTYKTHIYCMTMWSKDASQE